MNIPGFDMQLYDMTKEEVLQKNVCIDCKKEATWYSPAGAKEYRISGLCEPCFDRITGEPMVEQRNGSDVAGTINKDHALAAQKTLDDDGYAKEWQVVVADDKMLMLDYDQRLYDCTLPEQFYDTSADELPKVKDFPKTIGGLPLRRDDKLYPDRVIFHAEDGEQLAAITVLPIMSGFALPEPLNEETAKNWLFE